MMAVLSVFYYAFSQKLMDTHHPFVVSVMGFATATMMSVVVTLFDVEAWKSLPHLSLNSWLGLLYLTIIGTAFCYM